MVYRLRNICSAILVSPDNLLQGSGIINYYDIEYEKWIINIF